MRLSRPGVSAGLRAAKSMNNLDIAVRTKAITLEPKKEIADEFLQEIIPVITQVTEAQSKAEEDRVVVVARKPTAVDQEETLEKLLAMTLRVAELQEKEAARQAAIVQVERLAPAEQKALDQLASVEQIVVEQPAPIRPREPQETAQVPIKNVEQPPIKKAAAVEQEEPIEDLMRLALRAAAVAEEPAVVQVPAVAVAEEAPAEVAAAPAEEAAPAAEPEAPKEEQVLAPPATQPKRKAMNFVSKYLTFTININIKPTKKPPVEVECVICGDDLPKRDAIKSPCENKHSYCEECLKHMVTLSIKDESLYPPSCCKKPIPKKNIRKVLSVQELKSYKEAEREFTAVNRLYCPNTECGKFVKHVSKKKIGSNVTCQHCRTEICTRCRGLKHEYDCPDDPGLKEVIDMSTANGWKRCPKCHFMVERMSGCWYILCKCGAGFCYECGVEFNNRGKCGCPGRTDIHRRYDQDPVPAAAVQVPAAAA